MPKLFFKPERELRFYAKQQLHADELPFFIPGNGSLLIETGEERIAPAICYESLQWNHAEAAVESGATIYLTSVAKSANGIAKADAHFPQLAERFSLPVLMVNASGHCDNFVAAGASAVWNRNGKQLVVAPENEQVLLLFDTTTHMATLHPL